MKKSQKNILWFKEISMKDVSLVGGKNASLGEMVTKLSKKGVRVPDGFATTTATFWYFINKTNLKKMIATHPAASIRESKKDL